MEHRGSIAISRQVRRRANSLPDYSQTASPAPRILIHRGAKFGGGLPQPFFTLRAGHRLCGAGSGNASAIIASTVAIALVLPIRRDECVIALPLCPTLARQLIPLP